MKILLCEDEQVLRERICRSLNQQGWQTESCASCEELYEAIDGTIDLLLLDVHLPDGCVYPTVAMLQKSFPIPVIFFSNDTEENLILRGYDLDCVTFMPKPLKPRILLAAVSSFARRNGLLQEDLEHGGWIWNDQEQKLIARNDGSSHQGATEISFQPSTAKIFLTLFRNFGKTISKEMLTSCISTQSSEASLRVRLVELRKKLPDVFAVESVRGSGYRLCLKEEAK